MDTRLGGESNNLETAVGSASEENRVTRWVNSLRVARTNTPLRAWLGNRLIRQSRDREGAFFSGKMAYFKIVAKGGSSNIESGREAPTTTFSAYIS